MYRNKFIYVLHLIDHLFVSELNNIIIYNVIICAWELELFPVEFDTST